MTTYSVADAKNGLPRLIDRAIEGEEVVISRHGKPVVELRPVVATATKGAPTTYAWLTAPRPARMPTGMTSVELLRQVYEEPDA